MRLTIDQARALGIDVDTLLGRPHFPAVCVAGPSLVNRDSGPGWWSAQIDGWRPATDNELHKSVRAEIKLKRRDREVISTFLGWVPKAVGKRKVQLIVAKRRRPLPDPANLLKSFNDALVRNGLLKDDSVDWLVPHVPDVQVRPELTVAVMSWVWIGGD